MRAIMQVSTPVSLEELWRIIEMIRQANECGPLRVSCAGNTIVIDLRAAEETDADLARLG